MVVPAGPIIFSVIGMDSSLMKNLQEIPKAESNGGYSDTQVKKISGGQRWPELCALGIECRVGRG